MFTCEKKQKIFLPSETKLNILFYLGKQNTHFLLLGKTSQIFFQLGNQTKGLIFIWENIKQHKIFFCLGKQTQIYFCLQNKVKDFIAWENKNRYIFSNRNKVIDFY